MNRALTILAFLALVACDDKKADEKKDDPSSKNATTTAGSASAAATTTAATTTAAPAAVTINDTDISTPADFEEKAEKDITKTSYKQDLASIESDMGKDKE